MRVCNMNVLLGLLLVFLGSVLIGELMFEPRAEDKLFFTYILIMFAVLTSTAFVTRQRISHLKSAKKRPCWREIPEPEIENYDGEKY